MNKLKLEKPANLVVDCDEILFNITPKWVKGIIKEKEKFSKIFDLSIFEEKNDDEIEKLCFSRHEFYINLWLKKKDEIDFELEENKKLAEEFFDIYDNEDFYTDLELTKMGNAIVQVSNTKLVNKLYIISRCTDNSNNKISILRSLFPNEKTLIIPVMGNHKKSDYIKNIDLTEGIIFDDEIKNINDYIDNGNISNMNFYIPQFGYNTANQELLDKAKTKNIDLIYY